MNKKELKQLIDYIDIMQKYGFNKVDKIEAKYIELFPYYLNNFSEVECLEQAAAITGYKYNAKTFRKYLRKHHIPIRTTGDSLRIKYNHMIMCKMLASGRAKKFEDKDACVAYLHRLFPDTSETQIKKGMQKVLTGKRKSYFGMTFQKTEKKDTRLSPLHGLGYLRTSLHEKEFCKLLNEDFLRAFICMCY